MTAAFGRVTRSTASSAPKATSALQTPQGSNLRRLGPSALRLERDQVPTLYPDLPFARGYDLGAMGAGTADMHQSWTSWLWSSAVLLSSVQVAVLPQQDPAPTDLPTPRAFSAAELRAARQQVYDLFSELYSSHTPSGSCELARTLEEQARRAAPGSVQHYVLLQEAATAAGKGEDVLQFFGLLDQLHECYAVDATGLLLPRLLQREWQPTEPDAVSVLLDRSMRLAEDAAREGRPLEAQELLRRNRKLIREHQLDRWKPWLEQTVDAVSKWKKLHARFDSASRVLRANPKNPGANLDLCKYFGLVHKDLDQALQCLEGAQRGELEPLLALDRRSAAGPGATEELACASLAEAWLETAVSEKDPELREVFAMRSGFWFERAMGSQSDPLEVASLAKERSAARVFIPPLRLFLCELDEVETRVGYGVPLKYRAGRDNSPCGIFHVGGHFWIHSLHYHPGSDDYSWARFDLNREWAELRGAVGVGDSGARSFAGLSFEILGDGKLLWRSATIVSRSQVEEFDVSVAGIRSLELRSYCIGDSAACHTVWIEPCLTK